MRLGDLAQQLQQEVVQPVHQINYARAVPQADEHPCNEQARPHRQAAARRRAETAPAKFAEPHHGLADGDRLEHVFPQPRAQRDVPAPPELAHRAGKEGLTEVFRQRHAEGLCGAQRQIHAAGKFRVELQGVAQRSHHNGRAGILRPVVKYQLDKGVGTVRDDDFFEKAPHHALHTKAQRPVAGGGRVQQRGGGFVPAVEGAFHHMGPEAQEGQHLPVFLRRLNGAAAHIHQIADAHEQEKADAQRLRDGAEAQLRPPGAVLRQPLQGDAQQKGQVLDAHQHQHQPRHAGHQQAPFQRSGLLFQRLAGGRVQRGAHRGAQFLRPAHGKAQQPHHGGNAQQPHDAVIGPAPVEPQAAAQQHTGAVFLGRQRPQGPHQRQKQQQIH